jgi:hypothetical protein
MEVTASDTVADVLSRAFFRAPPLSPLPAIRYRLTLKRIVAMKEKLAV